MNQGQVVEILVEDAHKSRLGTGYLICDGCVLTAQHVIEGSKSKKIKCRLLERYNSGKRTKTVCHVLWEDDKLDVALLSAPWKRENTTYLPVVRTINASKRIRCRAYGFPDFRKEKKKGKTSYSPYVVEGWIKPLESKEKGELLVDIEGAIPKNVEHWKGISGAAIFTEDNKYLIGVLLEAPRAISGSLTGRSIESIIASSSSFSTHIKECSQQFLQCLNPEEIYAQKIEAEAIKTFEIIQEVTALNVIDKVRATEYQLRINHLDGQLKHRDQGEKYTLALSNYPKQQLLTLLNEVEKTHGESFWRAWKQSSASSITQINVSVDQAYAILWQQEISELHSFLSHLYQLLEENDQNISFTTRLAKLMNDVCDKAPIVESQPVLAETSANGKGCLLVKLEHRYNPEDRIISYVLSVWFIRDVQAYQGRFKAPEDMSSSNLSGYSKKLIDSELITISSDDAKVRASIVKREISKALTQIWEDNSLGLELLRPSVVFCVPMELLEVDFQNMELGELAVIGLQLPVSVSCLERYQTRKLRSYRQTWIRRWQVLEKFHREKCSSHIEIYNDKDVDITCPKAIFRWLNQKDLEKKPDEKIVAGLAFYLPYNGLTDVFKNIIKNGLSVVIWPNEILKEEVITKLQEHLEVVPSKILKSVHRHRAKYSGLAASTDSVSILVDNPHLPPPDCEVDYY